MTEDWRTKLQRECGEVHAAIIAALAKTSDEETRAGLEAAARMPQFGGMTWLWGPALAKRSRVLFRPFILSNFSRESITSDGRWADAWMLEPAGMKAWLEAADAADDVDVVKRLLAWQFETSDGDARWRAEVLRRATAATTPAARNLAIAKVDLSGRQLDGATALALWQLDRKVGQPLILAHLPWRTELAAWAPLLAASRDVDPTFHFDLYRRIVDEKRWRADLAALPVTPDISAELERRHPAQHWVDGVAEVFHALLEKHGAAAIPYVQRHADNVTVRFTWRGTKEGKGLPDLLALAVARGWLPLWATLLRTAASATLFDKEIAALVEAEDRERLALVPGRGPEVHTAAWSWARINPLTDATATALYEIYPDLLRGPFRGHVAQSNYPRLIAAALAAGDDELVDYFAARLALVGYHPGDAVALLVRHFEALDERAFVTRASGVLSRMAAHGIWSYPRLIEANALTRLLFERSTTLYLGDAAAIRDLLESPQIHVQLLAFRVLGSGDPRAPALAAANVDLLQATLLRKLHRKSRQLAFAALAAAASHDEATARGLLERMRDAMAMPDRRYDKEALVGLIGRTLHRWPALRTAREQPKVYA